MATNKIIVVGGGPAGMMAAITAAETGCRVILIDKNEKVGKKLFITGKGRCNLTNACPAADFFENVVSNRKFMYSAFYDFDNRAVIAFFNETGCLTKEERGMRIFPQSDRAADVIGALKRRLARNGVEVILACGVKGIMTDTSGENKVTGVRLDDGRSLSADRVIVATGGISYPLTGSTGDGYRFARDTGHKVTDVLPALVPLQIKEEWCGELQGLSLKNIAIVMETPERIIIYQGFGEMLFTHFGVSGPLILSASSYYIAANKSPINLFIDLKPALSAEQLDRRLLRDFENNINKQFKNILAGLLPGKMHSAILRLSGISGDKKINEISRKERERLVTLLKRLPLSITGTRGFSEAIITRGGIAVKDINPSTMESKKVCGLFFAGEILDVDALTGGFNLQIAWSTGHLAGRSASI